MARMGASGEVSMKRRASRRLDRVRLELHPQGLLDHPEDGREIIHRRIATIRKHPVKALRRFCRLGRKRLEAHSRIDEIAQYQPPFQPRR